LKAASGVVTRFQKGHKSYPRGIRYQHYHTTAQIEWLKQNSMLPNHILTERFNREFGLSQTVRQIVGIKYRHKMAGSPHGSGSARFRTGYKEGMIPPFWVPVGTVRLQHTGGYVEVKIKDGCGLRNWKPLHRIVWEAAHGSIPKDCIVIFADGNPLNSDLSNLLLISRREHAVINSVIKRGKCPEATRASVPLADLILGIKEARRC
jgi:hypothetical protein